MKMLPPGNRVTVYLLAACLLLAGVLVVQSRQMVGSRHEAPAASSAQATPETRTSFVTPGINAFGEITERPLFAEDRRPPPEPEAPAAPLPPPQPLRLRLEGIAITPQAQIAILRDLSNNKILRLAPGMQHQGWELAAIGAGGVTFKRGERDQEITLSVEKKPPLSR